jgi:CRISPR-associated endoribonuclease Cas6
VSLIQNTSIIKGDCINLRFKIVFELKNGKIVPFNRKKQIAEWLDRSLQEYCNRSMEHHHQVNFSEFEEYSDFDDFDSFEEYTTTTEVFEDNSAITELSKKINGFVFSDLYVPRPWRFDEKKGIISLSRRAILKVSLLCKDDIHLDTDRLIAIFNDQPLHFQNTTCYVTNIITLKTIKISKMRTKERFEAISPVVVSEDRSGRKWYLEPSSEAFFKKIRENLIEKYRKMYNIPEGEIPDVKIEADFEKTRTRKIAHAISIDDQLIRGYKINFAISGPEEVIKIAYEAGIGEKNDLGFGMLELSR